MPFHDCPAGVFEDLCQHVVEVHRNICKSARVGVVNRDVWRLAQMGPAKHTAVFRCLLGNHFRIACYLKYAAMSIPIPEGFDVMLQEKPHSNARSKEAAQNAIHFSLHKAVVLLQLRNQVLYSKGHRLNHFRMLFENLAEQMSKVFVLLVCVRNR